MIKVCHFSDWHGHARKLPEADLYVCTGDMYPNFPVKDRDKGSYTYRDYLIVPEHEVQKQREFADLLQSKGGFRRFLGSPDAPVVLVRGNHDFTDLRLMFRDCNSQELVENELLTVRIGDVDLMVTGHRGIPYIFGTWNDEV